MLISDFILAQAILEQTTQVVPVERLIQRDLIARHTEIDAIEKRWQCKIVFPTTEEGTDNIAISGPVWTMPKCVDELLVSGPVLDVLQFPPDSAFGATSDKLSQTANDHG